MIITHIMGAIMGVMLMRAVACPSELQRHAMLATAIGKHTCCRLTYLPLKNCINEALILFLVSCTMRKEIILLNIFFRKCG